MENYKKKQLEERLVNNNQQINKKEKSCCLCCFSNDKESEEEKKALKYIKLWRKNLEEESIQNTDCPFNALAKLWAYQNAIKDLETIRINPNLLSIVRNDLEFYIPQLCTFLLFGVKDTVDELAAFLCKASYSCVFFAHRVIWFFLSMNGNNLNPSLNQKINGLINIIFTMFKSSNNSKEISSLKIPNSDEYLQNMKMLNRHFFYSQKIIKSLLDEQQLTYLNRSLEITKFIEDFDKESISNNSTNENSNTSKSYLKLDKQDVYIKIYYKENESFEIIDKKPEYKPEFTTKINKKYSLNENYMEESLKIGSKGILSENDKLLSNEIDFNNTGETGIAVETINEKYDENDVIDINNTIIPDEEEREYQVTDLINSKCRKDINLNVFSSAINFYEHLGNIGDHLLTFKDKESSMTFLKNKLIEVNKKLPANIYLPFLRVRNMIIAHISIPDAKIFKTKNRAPFMIVLECFRIEELDSNYEFSNDNNLLYKEDNPKTNTKRKYNKRKSNSFGPINRLKERSGKMKLNDSFEEINKKNDQNTNIKTVKLSNKDPIWLLSEKHDVINSKAIVLNDCINKNKILNNMTNETKIIIEEEEAFSISNKSRFSKSKKVNKSSNDIDNLEENINSQNTKNDNIDFIIKKRLTNCGTISIKIPKVSNSFTDNETNQKDKYKSFNENRISENMKSQFDETYIKRIEDKEDVERDKKADIGTLKGKKKRTDLKDFPEKDRENLIEKMKNIFGEKYDEMESRIKKTSPYGKLESYKLIKLLVKAGEDLRQEQFATQLINEFNQIFYLEKMDIRLNIYEIISTGTNVGIVEFINDSTSIDELKRSTNLSLKDFFDIYYTPNFTKITRNEALNNFISSFVGYCLVCYFLQIKDRHNANILIDRKGFISHIDFGFMLTNAPGKGFEFEKAPFKFTNDILELIGGVNSSHFDKFRKLLWKGFLACVKHSSKIITLVEMMYCGHGNSMPCFRKGKLIIIL